jgi:SpoVK/Ycf46/Vps4 family AAA+-type ATPase
MIANGSHELVRKDILKLETSEFDGDKMVVLSDKTIKMLYQAYPALLTDPKNSGLISSASLTEKKLFFNSGVKEQVGSLEDILKPSRFRAYRKELKHNKLKEGITAIFFGAPGTGKTEAVYQIARKTGRDIMMVDLSQTKSKWFGESEKVVKKIFDDYASLLKVSPKEPILFINEADGFFSKRTEMNGNRGSSTDQTNNIIQNILLQALENFEGILLATTNLTENLDKAFERRFSFRINFAKPDVSARQSIWKSKLPDLSERNAAVLAEKFEITGGEIDVQVRQMILKKVLNKKTDIFEVLVESCSKNHGFGGKRKLGF